MLRSTSGHKEANPLSILNELKRRNVFKVGIAYVIVAWLVAQVLQLVFESFGTPAWAIKTVLVLLATGLPFALFFAWAFELTPEGLKRESEVDRSQSIVTQTGRKLNLTITTLMFLALAYFAYDKFVLSEDREAALVEAATEAVLEQAPAKPAERTNTEKSIAVLPFVNMSSDPEQEYFSDGISEELLNGLAKIESLKVAARTSSFSFKGQNKPIGEIAQVLGVEHILEGSVRKSGSQIRITAQLIRVSDGFHMWSETYDRELVNIFAIQDEITESIVGELRVKLDVMARIATTTSNPEAYQEYLRGRYYWNLRETPNLYQSIEHLKKATNLDPSYYDAWIALGEAWVLLPVWEFNDAKAPQQIESARLAVDKALTFNPKSGRAHSVMAYANTLELKWPEAFTNFDLAILYEPENATVWHWYGAALGTIGESDNALEAMRKASELDPRSRIIGTSYTDELIRAGKYAAARDQIDKTLAFAPDFLFGWQLKGFIHVLLNEYEEARTAFNRISELSDKTYFDIRTLDYIEESVQTGQPGPVPDWIDDPGSIDQYYASFALVCAGQYEGALDFLERQSQSNIPHLAAFYLHTALFREKMGHLPRYRELVKKLATIETDID